MAKNTRNSEFRRIDVDQFNEDLYRDDENGDTGSVPQGPEERQVTQLLNACKHVDALQYTLQHAPVGCRSQNTRDQALQLVMRVLTAFRSSDIEAAVKTLSAAQVDLLMKYVYRGFELPTEGSSGQLLVWHERLFAAGGHGSIVRVLTDRQRV